MARRLQTGVELRGIYEKATAEQREHARLLTFNVEQCVRPGALLAEREVLELIEAMLIQVADFGSLEWRA